MEIWSAPRPFPEGWFDPSIAVDGSGHLLAGYAQLVSSSPLVTRVAVADLVSADEWVEGFELGSEPDDFPVAMTVAAGPDGTAAACFTSQTSADPATAKVRHRVLYRAAGSEQWEEPVDIVGSSESAQFVRIRQVQVAPTGLAVVLADRYEGPDPSDRVASLFVSAHARGEGWTPPRQVNPQGAHVGGAALALDANGNATIAYVHRYQDAAQLSSIRVINRDAATTALSAPTILTPEDGVHSVPHVRLAANADGAALIGTQVGAHVNVTTRDTMNGGWQPMTALFSDETASSSNAAALGVSHDGTGYVMFWRQGPITSGNDVIGVARRLRGQSWRDQQELSARNMNLFDGAITFRGTETFLVYSGAIGFAPGAGEQGVGVLQASRWRDGAAAPDAPADIAPKGARHNLAQVFSDSAGSITVTENVFTGASSRTFATTLDRVLVGRFTFTLPGPVTAVAVSADATMLAAAAGKIVRVLDLTTGRTIRDISHGATVNAVTFTADGAMVLTGSADATARLTTIATGDEITRVTHAGPVTAVAVSSDRQRLATASADGTARLVTLAGGVPRRLTHDDAVNAVAFSADGKLLATASDDAAARTFNTTTGALLLTFGQGGPVNDVVFTRDGARLATAGADGTARMYRVDNGEQVITVPHDGSVHALALGEGIDRMGTASADGTSRIVNTLTGVTERTLRHGTAVTAVAFSADGKRIATATTEHIAYVYETAADQPARLRHPAAVHDVVFASDNAIVVTGCADKAARVFTLGEA